MPKPKDENRDLNSLILTNIKQWTRQMKPGQCIEVCSEDCALERLANLKDGRCVYVSWIGAYSGKFLNPDEAAIWLSEYIKAT